MPKFIDLTDKKFGRLTVLKRAENHKVKTAWECSCECGKLHIVTSNSLHANKTLSCGCLQREKVLKDNFKHGQSGTPEYYAWANLKTRCFNPKTKAYPDYGGRGITVCDRWIGEHGFENFLADMGLRPSSEHSLDRIDVNGNYEPANCKWSTKQQQVDNRRAYQCIEKFSMEELQEELNRRTPEYGLSLC